MRLSEAAEAFLGTKRLEGLSPRTIDGYRFHIGHLCRALGDPQLEDVTLQHLRDHLASKAHLKPASVAGKVRCFRSLFKWLAEEEVLVKNPTLKLKEPKLPDRVPKALSVEEVELLRDACRTIQEHALVEFFFATGGRVGELVALNRNAIDWQRAAVLVFGKGAKEREVYLGAKATIWLRRYLGSRRDTDLALFVTTRAPHRLTVHQAEYIFRRVASRAGLQGRVTPHVMRHTLATTMLNNGAPLAVVQAHLGHTKPETTMLYARLSGEARREAFKRYFVQ